MISNQELFTKKIAKLLLQQSGIISFEEELTPESKNPSSVGDILRSKDYWNHKVKNLDEK